MNQETPHGEVRVRRKRKRSRSKPSAWWSFRIEIAALFFFALGVFLLLEEMEIKETLFKGVVNGFKAISNGFVWLLHAIQHIFERFEFSDLVGFLFIMIALVLLLIQFRRSLLTHYAVLDVCPECGGELRHIHRLPFQRFLSWLLRLKIRRYGCRDCTFTGVRIRQLTHHR